MNNTIGEETKRGRWDILLSSVISIVAVSAVIAKILCDPSPVNEGLSASRKKYGATLSDLTKLRDKIVELEAEIEKDRAETARIQKELRRRLLEEKRYEGAPDPIVLNPATRRFWCDEVTVQ